MRRGLRIAPTSVSADVNGFGLFAPKNEELPRGSFLGVYTADSWRWASMDSPYRGTNEYVMQVGMWRASPKIRFQSPRVNVHRSMVMAIQEPPEGVAANCHLQSSASTAR